MKRETLFLVFLVFIILGCPVQTGTGGRNLTYNGLGVLSFTSDLYNFPKDTITNIMLQIHNYGDYDATNVQSMLVGIQGTSDIQLQGSDYEIAALPKDNDKLFYWTLKFGNPAIQTDVTYSINAKIYYEYQSDATKEVRFRKSSGTSYVEAGGGNSRGPLNITLSSPSTVYLPNQNDNEFTITVRIENNDSGYPTCRKEEISSFTGCKDTGMNEEESYRNYIKGIDLYLPFEWEMQRPDEWSCVDEATFKHCAYAPDFTDSANVDGRLYLTQGKRNVFNIGFLRGNADIDDETDKFESMRVVVTYSYAVSSPDIDLTVEGSEQTY